MFILKSLIFSVRIIGSYSKLYIRFLDAHILNVEDNKLPMLFIKNKPFSIYQQIENRDGSNFDDFFFKKIY